MKYGPELTQGLSLDHTYPAAEGDLAYLVFYNQGKTLTASSDEMMKIAH